MGAGAHRVGGRVVALKGLVVHFAFTGFLCAGEATQGGCTEDDGQCAASSGPSSSDSSRTLRWRGYPYRVSNPAFAKTIYGGDYIRAAFEEQGFEGPMDGDDWDVLWTHRPQDGWPLLPRPGGRLLNHCGYFGGAGDKCGLARHVARLQATAAGRASEHRHFRTYEILRPDQAADWERAVREEPQKYWVLKPCKGGASKGIQIVRGQEALDIAKRDYSRESTVAQEYLEQPFLGFGGRKFHLRLYIVVTRWDPVGAFLYNNGLVFRSLHTYSQTPGSRDAFSSISSSVEALPLTALWEHLDSEAETGNNGVLPASPVWARIVGLLREVLGRGLEESFGDPKATRWPKGIGCFDLFGADVILDRELRPLVMELNSGPNMWISDHGEAHQDILAAVKAPMVRQMVRWIDNRIRRGGEAAAAGLPAAALVEEEAVLANFTQLL